MGKNKFENPIAAAIRDLSDAVRAHTDHVKEDDQRYWDEKNADVKEDTMTDDESIFESSARRNYLSAINQVRRSQAAIYGESSRPFPEFVQKIMQETPHMFTRPTRVSGLTVDFRVPRADCRICGLKSANPVHLIQIAELSFRED